MMFVTVINTNILERWLNRECINLGFSGNALLDLEIRPVGLVYIAVDTAGFSFCKELHLSGDRAKIREQAADAVFQLILDTI